MRRDRFSVLAIGFVTSLLWEGAAFGAILRVDDDSTVEPPTADGSTWALAFPTLDDALDAASSGDVIWVAGGVYTPASSSDSIVIDISNIRILGGFAADDDERDIDVYETVLSGAHMSGNSDRVIDVVSPSNFQTFLEGFTIEDGSGSLAGAGIRVGDSANPAGIEVRLCIIQENSTSTTGGAIACLDADSEPVFRLCTITANSATTTGGDGGAVYTEGAPKFLDCMFSENDAGADGGAVSIKKGRGSGVRVLQFHRQQRRR